MAAANLYVTLLAAGRSTRMRSARSKVLQTLAGRALIEHVLDAAAGLEPAGTLVVVGREGREVAERVAPTPIAIQDPPLGTGHAVTTALAALGEAVERDDSLVLVIFGDTPLVSAATLKGLVAPLEADPKLALVGLAFRPPDPLRYGRVLLDSKGEVERIVEFGELSDGQKTIALCNGGALAARAPVLKRLLAQVKNDNAKGEYYLPDVFRLAREAGLSARTFEAPAEEMLGVDSRAQLAVAEAVIQTRLRGRVMALGATLLDPTTVWLSHDTTLAEDVTVFPSVFFGPGVSVGRGSEIRSFCHLEGVVIGENAIVGPFARLRPGSEIGDGAHIGNFVEVKNAVLGEGAKANHLSYLGDASVGAAANIGAGTITCNYDGFAKHRTEIGAGAFIGSNTALVAPVSVGKGAVIGAGSTITTSVPDDALAVARGEQRNVADGATRIRERKGTGKKKG